ncbi:MAG: hypothetical protein ACRDOO_29555 [Actinomadura sp.]
MICATDAPDYPEQVDIAEVTPDPACVARLRSDRPTLTIAVAAPTAEAAHACVKAGAELLVGDHLAEVSAATGTGLVCSDPGRAIATGVRPDGLIVEPGRPGQAPIHRVEELVLAGHAVLVTSTGTGQNEPSDEAAPPLDTATVSVYAWLGARVFRVRAQDAPAVRQALDMVASIKGLRPPTVSRRGLV